ncbi:hypothetical protein A3197_09820 [Candidatus Thiodiazotropha endoloripes]|nr:hypothetical protein A3197_09820 [Candidatus Thiodiazotropha endoloripes]
MSEHLQVIYEYLKLCRRKTPPGPGIESSIEWLKDQVQNHTEPEPDQTTELVMIELGANDWLIVENEKEIPVTHQGSAFETIAGILSGPDGQLCLYDFLPSVDALRKTKIRVVDRLNSCGANLMADYIDRNLRVHRDNTITVTSEPGVFFMVNRLSPES